MTTPTQAQAHERKVLPIYVTKIDELQGIVDAVVNVFGIVDLGDDIIHNGAYTKTLNERGNKIRVKVLDSHNTDSVLRVIGKPLEIREVGRDELARLAPEVIAEHPEATGGLFTRTQYLLDTPEGLGVFKRIASGALNEYSIALDALQVDYGKVMVEGKERTVRNIRALRLWEYSAVIFGMNQATVTTDVKQSVIDTIVAIAGVQSEAKKDTPMPETKRGSLSAKLEANMRMGYAYCVNEWLTYGMIDAETISMLDLALASGMSAFRTSIPQSIAEMEVEYYAAGGSEAQKAGRMISARNRTNIQQAIDALQALLDADAPDEAEDEESKADEKASTGPDGQPDAVPAPSIATPDEGVDTAVIERELAELDVMMELVT